MTRLSRNLCGLLVGMTALAPAGCGGQDRSPVAAVAVETVPLCYEWSVDVQPSSVAAPITVSYPVCLDSPEEAYDVALQRLWDLCESEGDQEACYRRSDVALFAAPVSGHISGPLNPEDTIAIYGYEATFARYAEGVDVVLDYLDSADVRATDVEESLAMMDSYTLGLEYEAEARVSDELEELVSSARAATERVTQMGEEVRGEEHGRLVRRRFLMARAREIIDRYQAAIDGERAAFALLADDYRDFHTTEPTTAAALEELVGRASESELSGIGALQVEAMALVVQENAAPQDFVVRAKRLAGFLDSKQEALERAIGPYRAFLEEQEVPIPDLTSQTISDLERMVGYLESRQQRFIAAGTKLLGQLRARREALVLLAMEAATRQTIADTARAHAAAEYLQTVTARVAAIWAAQPSAGGVELLRARYDGVLSLLQIDALCGSEDRPVWMADGCVVLDRERSKAQLYLSSSLRLKLLVDENRLRNAGGNPSMLDAMRDAVNNADFAVAVFIHDEVANAVEAG